MGKPINISSIPAEGSSQSAFAYLGSKIRLPHFSVSPGRTLSEVTPELSPTAKSVIGNGAKAAGKTITWQLVQIAAGVVLSAAVKELGKRASGSGASGGQKAA